MARTAHFRFSLWDNDEFTSLMRMEKWMYFVLMYSTRHTNNLGVIPVTYNRWGNTASDITAIDCVEPTRTLALKSWIVLDESTDEIFLPRYMTDNFITKQPNMLRGAIRDVEYVWSPIIRLAIADVFSKVGRPDAQKAAEEIRAGVRLSGRAKKLPNRPVVSREVRAAVYERDDWRCVYCNIQFGECEIGKAPENVELGIWLELDHIKPYSLGGEDTYDNFRSACSTCNRRRGVDDADLWAGRMAER